MPIAYKCFICDNHFSYTEVRTTVVQPKNHNNKMTIKVSCKQPTYCAIGMTGDDYICVACIFKAIITEGLN